MILPYSTALGLGKIPWTTMVVALLCLVIHYNQSENRYAIEQAADRYCASIHSPYADEDPLDYLAANEDACRADLAELYSVTDSTGVRDYYIQEEDDTDEKFDDYINHVRRHMDAFSQEAPASLDRSLKYHPDSWNPVSSLLSGLAHSDWGHVIGNLIFFLAFAPAVELLAGGSLRFIGIMVLIELACDVTYSVVMLGSTPIPTLGLSGVVMGVIGLSAYLMPWARIRTFVWFIVFFRTFYIPAWMLALWYIGWDTYALFAWSDNSSVNFVAHVSAAVAGYLIGVLLLKQRREESREELADEIEYQNSLSDNRLGMLSSNKGYKRQIENEQRETRDREDYSKFIDQIYQLVNVHQHSEAIVLLLEKYELYAPCPEIYEEIFWDMHKWRQGRALLCIGRLNINHLVAERQYTRALAIAEACIKVKDDFALADSSELLQLVDIARSQLKYDLAYRLVRNASLRYPWVKDTAPFRVVEADLLEQHMNDPQAAADLISNLSG